MDIKNHSNILEAYVARMNSQHLEFLLGRIKDCEYAQMNYGNNAQISMHNALQEELKNVLKDILRSDKDNIENIIKRNI